MHRTLKRPRHTPKNAIKPDTKSMRKMSFWKVSFCAEAPECLHSLTLWMLHAAMEKNSTRHCMKGSLSAQISTHTHIHFSLLAGKEHKFLRSESQYSFQESYFVNFEARVRVHWALTMWARSALIFQKCRGCRGERASERDTHDEVWWYKRKLLAGGNGINYVAICTRERSAARLH